MQHALQPLLSADIDEAEARLIECGAQEAGIPINHHFAPGVYMREAVIPAGMFVIGHRHRYGCANVLLSGSCLVKIDGRVRTIKAPYVINSAAGTRKALIALTEVRWMNVHATTETDLEKIEAATIEKTPAFIAMQTATKNKELR